jgi:hypothetical protein
MNKQNEANISGRENEIDLENFLKKHDIPYKSGGNTSIDFIIHGSNKYVYVECCNQNVGGSVDEKIPHKIWKYHDRIKFDKIIIQIGTHKIKKEIIKHIKFLEESLDIVVVIMTMKEVKDYILNVKPKKNKFFEWK